MTDKDTENQIFNALRRNQYYGNHGSEADGGDFFWLLMFVLYVFIYWLFS